MLLVTDVQIKNCDSDEYLYPTCAGIKTGMEWLMKVQHGKGVANHPGPESCVPAREGRRFFNGSGGEALTGENAGKVLSPDIKNNGLPTPCREAEGNIEWRVIASVIWNPRGPRPLACVEAPCARTGRSHVHLLEMAKQVAWSRPEAVIP